jgi:hypothetical protein
MKPHFGVKLAGSYFHSMHLDRRKPQERRRRFFVGSAQELSAFERE